MSLGLAPVVGAYILDGRRASIIDKAINEWDVVRVGELTAVGFHRVLGTPFLTLDLDADGPKSAEDPQALLDAMQQWYKEFPITSLTNHSFLKCTTTFTLTNPVSMVAQQFPQE